MESIVEKFKQWLIEDGKATSTVSSYINDVNKFNEYLKEREVDRDVLLNRFYFTTYVKYLKGQGAAINTINKKITSLKVYNEWLLSNGIVDGTYISIKRDKVKVASGSEDEVSVLNDKEVERFLFALEKENDREKALGYILLYTGLRVSEVINIELHDIDHLSAQLRVRGKGGKVREVPLRLDVLEIVQAYRDGERKNGHFPNSPYLFVSQRAQKLHRDTVRKWLEQLGKQLHIHLQPHKLRHTFCTRLLKNGVDLTVVAKLAGHASINTTMKHYINVSKVEKKKTINKTLTFKQAQGLLDGVLMYDYKKAQ